MRYTSITSTTNGPLHSSKSNTSSSGSTATSTVSSQHLLDHLQVAAPPSTTISPSASESSLAQPHHCGTFATASKIGKSCTVYKLGETVYSGPASGRRCGARPDDVATSHNNSSSDPASHHTLCALHLSVSTSTTPPFVSNSCLHASKSCSPNGSKVNGSLSALEFNELSTKNTASSQDCSTGRSFEASLRELNLTCSNRSFSSPPSIPNTNLEGRFDSSTVDYKPVPSVAPTDEDVSFSLDQSSFGVKVLCNSNNTSNVHEVNGYISDTKERSRGLVAGCKAGPRSRVKRLSKTLNSNFDSVSESQTDLKDLQCSVPSRVQSENYSLAANSICLLSSGISNSVDKNELKSVFIVDGDSVDKPYVLGNEPTLTIAHSEVQADSKREYNRNCADELVGGGGDTINDVDNRDVHANIPAITPEAVVGINPGSKNGLGRVSELKANSSRRSSVSSGEINTRPSSPESVIALTEGDPLQLDVAEASLESAVLTVSSIDSGLSVSDPNNLSTTENGSVVAIADSALTPSDDESSHSEIVISCGSVITGAVLTQSQESKSFSLPAASTLSSASSCAPSSTEKKEASALEHTNRNEGVQKKARSIVQVKQVAKPRRSPRTSPLGTPLSSPHNTPRNSPLPPVDAGEECDLDEASQSACGRSLRSRTLSNVVQHEKLRTIVEDISEGIEKEPKISLCSSTNIESSELKDSKICAADNRYTSGKDQREETVINIPVACHTRSSISKPCNGLEKPLDLLANSGDEPVEQVTRSVEVSTGHDSRKLQNGDSNPNIDRPLPSSSDQSTFLFSGRNLRRNSVPVSVPNSHSKIFSVNSVSLVATNTCPLFRRTTRSLSSDCSSFSNSNKVCALNVAKLSSVVPVVTISSSPTISVATTLSRSGTATIVSSSHSAARTRHHSTAQETISSCTDTKFSVDDSKFSKVDLPLPDSGLSSREMVRLIQDHSNSFDSYCKRRGNRSSRRLCSADTILESDKQQSKLLNLRKHGRSDSYFSESEDSCGAVEDVAIRNGRSTGHTKASTGAGTNGLGIHLFEKMATRNTSKSVTDSLCSNVDTTVDHNSLGFTCTGNGNESLRQRLLNGSATGRLSSKNKHRNHRSALASDDSDCSSTISKSNCLDRESDKVDINLLLEISVADRDKFEKKKSKLRKKNADWCLISETEKIINEKEEIMKNKNRPDSSTDDESDEDEEPLSSHRLESRIPSKISVDHNSSEDSDSNFFVPERKKSCRKTNKKYRTSDESFKLDSKNSDIKKDVKSETSKSIEFTKDNNTPNVSADNSSSKSTEVETIPVSRPKGRPKGSRNRRTLYDLTRLNEDTDDDNFFSFPVNSGLGQSPVTVACRDRRSSRSNTARLNGGDQHASNTSKKRLSDAERFLRDNREYYQFPETRERLRTSHERSDGERARPDDMNSSSFADDDRLSGKEEMSRKSKRGRPVSPCPENCKVSSNRAPLKTNIRRGKLGRFAGKRLRSKGSEDELLEEELRTFEDNSSEKSCEATVSKKAEQKEEEANFSDGGSVSAVIPCCTAAVDQIVFSFEHVPKAEPWYQTYKRQVDGNKDHEFNNDEDYLRFVLPYEMPKEYFRDPLAKRNLANKKRADLAELARKSPRCHASTLALFSDILPGKKKQSKRAKSYCSAREEDQGTSDGTSTPGTDSNSRLLLTEHFETLDDFIAIEHCMNVLLRAAQQRRDLPSMEELKDDLSREAAGAIDCLPPKEENEVKPDPDYKRELRDGSRKDKRDAKEKVKEKDETSDDEEADSKKDMSRRKKRKRLCSSSSTTSNSNKIVKSEKPDARNKCVSAHPIDFLKELKLENDPLASEVDPQFLIEMQDYIIDKSPSSLCSTLDVSAAELCAHAGSCKCANVPQYHCYDDVSSVDGNTEVSSECLSLVDSENLDTTNFGKIHVKKRRKNLTGWPKIKKKRLTPTVPTSEDNDSALGFDDHISRKSKRTVRADQVSSAADDSERRASPRKKVVALDAVPLRLRSAK